MRDLQLLKENYVTYLGVLQLNESLIEASIEKSLAPLLELKDFKGAKKFLVDNFNDSPFISLFFKFNKIIEQLEFNEEFVPGY